MPFLEGPFTPAAGVPIQAKNPVLGSGNVESSGIDVRNYSPFLLQISNGSGSSIALIDPLTRDWVPLDATAGQLVTVTPVDVGVVSPGTVQPLLYIMWYQSSETPPVNLPIALGSTQVVAYNSSGGP